MGSISDCCVADDSRQLRIENEGSNNMDTCPSDPLLATNDRRNNPSIYAKQDANNDPKLQTQPNDKANRENNSITINLNGEAIKQSLDHQHDNNNNNNNSNNNTPTSSSSSSSSHSYQKRNSSKTKTKSSLRIIVTEPLSPRQKLQGHHRSFEHDDHPYSRHKSRQKSLTNGYIRRYNITSTAILPDTLTNLIFDFYYFHYADFNSQLSILNNIKKQHKSIQLITSKHSNEEDLSQFLETILKSKLAEKMWNKFDSDLKGVVETDKITQFMVLPVILYKSTLHHRKKKERNGANYKSNKPNLDKKAIKHDVEHLSVWIITTFGDKQRDNSYHFRLTKDLYQTKLAHFVDQYIQNYS